MFYIEKEKIVPSCLDLLTSLALAHWIMQDGSYHISSRGIYICTDYFKQSDTIRLANHLIKVLKIKCTTPKAPGILGE